MKRQKRTRILVSVLAALMALMMILPMIANIFVQ